jgi:hypothetical protein
MNLIVNAVTPVSEHTIAWLSLQPDNAVSVGLSDRAFISPRFRARQFLWNVDNRVTVQYVVAHEAGELRPVANPHLTFHPPVYFHLRANNDEELFAGIADVEIMLAQDGLVPWVRFVSRPVREMSRASAPRNPGRTSVLRVPVENEDHSVGLAVDFVQPGVSHLTGATAEQYLDSGLYRMHVSCTLHTGQLPTLAWYHQY